MPAAEPTPPIAPRQPHHLVAHDDHRLDDWYWLNERANPKVIALLEAENAYTGLALAHTEALQEQIYKEMVARIQETDDTAPAPKAGWWYLTRTEEGKQYGIVCRRRGAPDGPEEIVLDQNALAAGHDFFALGGLAVSPSQRLVAYSTDLTGGEKFTLHVRDLEAGADLEDVIDGTYYGLAWTADESTIFYTRPDDAMRPFQLWRHRLGTAVTEDVLVYQEDDDRFFLSVDSTRTERFVVLHIGSKVTDEVHVLDSEDPNGEFKVVAPREQGVEYSIEHQGDRFLIITNVDDAENFKLVETPVSSPGRENWRDVVGVRDDVRLDGVDPFARHLVLHEKKDGLRRLRVIRVADGDDHVIELPEPVYAVGADTNMEYDTNTLRFAYESMVTPRSVFAYDMESRERVLLKQQPVLGGYDPSAYETTREWATAPDGAQVPISLVHRHGIDLSGANPTVLYGYGSYETSIDPRFSSLRLSLLDRGVVYAIGHVRGGGEMGRQWYEDGKLLRKVNTFTDFIACAEHLIARGFTSTEKLVIRGGSAGGLLMGATVNLRPDLFAAVVAEVPFVDCLTTILDETLPLTVLEWEEWGNPVKDADVYRYMKSYSPVDNVEAKDYPRMLVTAGLNDPRVSYWEPAKWVQKLRSVKTDINDVLLKVELGAGHMGPSGRYDAWKDEALVYAFILDAVARDQ